MLDKEQIDNHRTMLVFRRIANLLYDRFLIGGISLGGQRNSFVEGFIVGAFESFKHEWMNDMTREFDVDINIAEGVDE